MFLDHLYKYKDTAILFARVGVGLPFVLLHGLPKIQGGPARWKGVGSSMGNIGVTFAPEFWGFMAAITEFGGGILLILGLFFRPSLLFMIFVMFNATLTHLLRLDPWTRVVIPFEYMLMFLLLLALGPGKISLDYLFFGRKKRDL